MIYARSIDAGAIVNHYLIDLSAWARSSHPKAAGRWQELLEADRLLCHPVFALELLHNCIAPRDYFELRDDLEHAFTWIRPDHGTAEIAMSIQMRMATGAACGQRVKTADLLIAALAVQHDVAVFHYDADYDRIHDFGGEDLISEWLAPKGSLDGLPFKASTERREYRRAFGERMIQLRDGADLNVWPKLIDWLDEELRGRGLPVPPKR